MNQNRLNKWTDIWKCTNV